MHLGRILALSVLGASAAGSAHASECDAVPGEFLVRFEHRTVEHRTLRELRVTGVRFASKAVPGLVRVRSEGWSETRAQRLIEEGLVRYVQPNCRVGRRRIRPSDARFGELWAFDNARDIDINAPEAWSITTGSADIVAGVVDGGIDIDHEDLRDNLWTNPWEIPGNGVDDDGNGYVDDVHGVNVLAGNGNVRDTAPDGHGSHGAGTIGATGDNGLGVVGVSWRVRLMGLAIFRGEDEGGTTADVLEAWEYALEMRRRGVNLRVLNNSYGEHGFDPGQAEIDMANRLDAAGIVLVLSAGNDGGDNDVEGDSSNLPTPNAINVAAVNREGELAEFSNYGVETVHLAAPGVGILSTIQNGRYASYDGTSQAAPIVAGVVALLLSREPELTPFGVRQRLMETARYARDLEGWIQVPGIVDAFGALTPNVVAEP